MEEAQKFFFGQKKPWMFGVLFVSMRVSKLSMSLSIYK